MFSPTFLLNFRYGLTQQIFPERRVSQGFNLASLGFAPEFVNLFPQDSAVPNVRIGSMTQLSSSEFEMDLPHLWSIRSSETSPMSEGTTP